MDEPLSNLDAKLRTQTRGEIRRLQQEVGTTTVYVTHDQVEAMTMGDRIAVMNDGLLEQVGTPEELYERPANRFVAGFIGSPGDEPSREAAPSAAAPARRSPARRARRAIVGVRPEHARPWAATAGCSARCDGTVAFVEALGRETFLGVGTTAARLVVCDDGRAAAQPGDRVEFGLVPDGLRFFDPESGARLPRATGAARATLAPVLSIELAVATPAFLDLTFVGLEALPEPGEERFAGELMRSPGGGAITAVAAARLGLQTALVAPLGNDLAGEYVRRELEDEGVAIAGFRHQATPQTVVMPVGDERTMVTVDPGVRARAADVAALTPVAIAANLDQLDLLPNGTRSYLTCGDDDARAFSRQLPPAVGAPRAVPQRARRARAHRRRQAPRRPPSCSPTGSRAVVITLGADRAIAVTGGAASRCPTSTSGPVVDTTGDRDLLCAAYALGRPARRRAEERLSWAQLYSRLAMGVPTATAGARHRGAAARGRRQARPLRPRALA